MVTLVLVADPTLVVPQSLVTVIPALVVDLTLVVHRNLATVTLALAAEAMTA